MKPRALFGFAILGAIATAIVVAASALLRITTGFDAGGSAHSMLPPALETAVRLAHRVGASMAGAVALVVVLVAVIGRRAKARLGLALASVALTAFLAVLGRFSAQAPGALVPICNALGGTLLVCAFAALAVQCHRSRPAVEIPRDNGVVTTAFLLVLGITACGIAAAANGGKLTEAVHVGLGCAISGALVYAIFHGYEMTRSSAARRLRRVLFTLALAQLFLGFGVAVAHGAAASVVIWLHALAGVAIAVGLAALASRALRPRSPD